MKRWLTGHRRSGRLKNEIERRPGPLGHVNTKEQMERRLRKKGKLKWIGERCAAREDRGSRRIRHDKEKNLEEEEEKGC